MNKYYIKLTKKNSIVVEVEAESKYLALAMVHENVESYFVDLERSQNVVELAIVSSPRSPKKVGRPKSSIENIPRIFHSYYPLYQKGAINISDSARLCSFSRPTIYKYLRLIGDTTPKKYDYETEKSE